MPCYALAVEKGGYRRLARRSRPLWQVKAIQTNKGIKTMPRYYLPWRDSITDADSVRSAMVCAKLKSLFKRVQPVYQFGWRNQPKVYAFTSDLDLDGVNERIKQSGLSDYYVWFPNAALKDW